MRRERRDVGRRKALFESRFVSRYGTRPMFPMAESEWATRKSRIDPQLGATGWAVTPFALEKPLQRYPRHAITEYPPANGPADYALRAGGRVLGIVGAKKLTVGPEGVLTQTERYARELADSPFDDRGCRVPFLDATDGGVIHFPDVCDPLNTSRQVRRFHTPAALEELLGRACARPAATPTARHRPRPDQVGATAAVEAVIAARMRLVN
jgi:type I restriction enzyme, R subunit